VVAYDRPAPGGEPLWRVILEPGVFVPDGDPAENVAAGGSRECPSAIFSSKRFDSFGFGHGTAMRWVVPGSRLSPSPARLFDTPTRIREDARIHAKAAPLQALGTNTPYQPANLFEDEDDDDWRPALCTPSVICDIFSRCGF
jgi:hypothetical protein